jgi:hypothetical protein
MSKGPFTDQEHFQVMLALLEGDGRNVLAVCHKVNRPYESVDVIPWKVVTNYEGKGRKLVAYIKQLRFKHKATNSKWSRFEVKLIQHWHENPTPQGHRALSFKELAVILGRTEAAVDKQWRGMYRGMKWKYRQGFGLSKATPSRPHLIKE